jgi:PKD domain-containing protein
MLLALPAGASAVTITVDPAAATDCGARGSGDFTCKTFDHAVNNALSNDTIKLLAGTFPESATVTVNAASLTIVGAGATQSTIAGSGAGPAIHVTADSVIVRNVHFDSSQGPALQTDNNLDAVQGSVLTSSASGQPAMIATSASAGDKTVTVDSSVLSGGSGASTAGLSLTTSGAFPTSIGNLNFTGRHDTIAGQAAGVVASALANGGLSAVGNIASTLSNSIVHGPSTATNNGGVSMVNLNSATIAINHGDSPAGGSNVTVTGPGGPVQNTPDASLFLNSAGRDFRLRADATQALGQGTGLASGEWPSDIGGVTLGGSTTDLGAAQFVDQPPTITAVGASPLKIASGQSVVFAAIAKLPEVAIGGSVTAFGWSFGDGQVGTSTPVPNFNGDSTLFATSTSHKYTNPGTYTVVTAAGDGNGGVSAVSSPLSITVSRPPATGGGSGSGGGSGGSNAPGTGQHVTGGPSVAIGSPRAGGRTASTRRISVRGRGRRKRTVRKRIPLVIAGTALAPNGLTSVFVALRPVAGGSCRWFDGHTSFRSGSCASPRFVQATISDFSWTLIVPARVKLSKGLYVAQALAVDSSGLTSGTPTSAGHSAITFTVT